MVRLWALTFAGKVLRRLNLVVVAKGQRVCVLFGCLESGILSRGRRINFLLLASLVVFVLHLLLLLMGFA